MKPNNVSFGPKIEDLDDPYSVLDRNIHPVPEPKIEEETLNARLRIAQFLGRWTCSLEFDGGDWSLGWKTGIRREWWYRKERERFARYRFYFWISLGLFHLDVGRIPIVYAGDLR